MPVDHPLTFFGPYDEFAGTGKDIGYPLLRDQGNSAYLRDTGDPTTPEGGQIEWGYYEEKNPRMVHPRDLLEKEQARLSPSQRDLEMEQIMEPLERAIELTPILGELGFDEKHSFNGLLQVTADGGPSIGESPEVRGLWYCESVWVKDGPGTGKLLADWMTDGRTELDHHGIDVARYYPFQKTEALHPATAATRRPSRSTTRRCTTASPTPRRATSAAARSGSASRRSAATSWSSPAGSAPTATPATSTCWRSTATACRCARTSGTTATSGASPMPSIWRCPRTSAWSTSRTSPIYDVDGPDAEALMEYLCVAKVGGDTPVGKGIYTHFLDDEGGVRADLTVHPPGRGPLPRDRRRRRRQPRLRLDAPHGRGSRASRSTVTDRTEDFVLHRPVGPERPRHAAGRCRRPGCARRTRTSRSPRCATSRSAASRSPPSASPTSASRAGNCTAPTMTGWRCGTRCTPRA